MDMKEVVRQRYGSAITKLSKEPSKKREEAGCCASVGSCCDGSDGSNVDMDKFNDMISGNLYGKEELAEMPEEVFLATFGCGNPTALAQLQPGEVVLDLGSGAGLDVLLSAKRVGATGKAYGLDMTDEMLAVARENQRKSGIDNVEFLKGEIEAIPLPDNSVDVIISNCVINLSVDKDKVIQEAFRVLKPGGRFAVSDIVLKEQLPDFLQKDIIAWVGCIAGALLEEEYLTKLSQAGFVNPSIQPTRVYDLTAPEADWFLEPFGYELRKQYDGIIYSGFVRASVPLA